MNRDDLPQITLDDHPVEVDCQCGAHSVIDPDEVRTWFKYPAFVCAGCNHVKTTTDLKGFYIATADTPMRPLCGTCVEAS